MRAFDSIDIQCGLWRAWHPVMSELPGATGGLVRGSGFADTTAAALVVLLGTGLALWLLTGRIGAALGRPYGPVVGRTTVVVVGGTGVVVALARLGVPLTITLPVLLTVVALLGALFVLAAAGLAMPARGRFDRHHEPDTEDGYAESEAPGTGCD